MELEAKSQEILSFFSGLGINTQPGSCSELFITFGGEYTINLEGVSLYLHFLPHK